ncbi:MAG TPA: transcriptional regulator, partial [Streptosporangiaceae bacterium]
IEALGHATARKDGTAADDALGRAARSAEKGAALPPPWPWLFPFDHAKLAGYRALVAVRLERPADALAAFAESLTAVQPAPKQRAIIMLEVATAARQDGTTRKDTARIAEAFQLAAEALSVGTMYSSERVIQRTRAFRRDYAGPVTSQVRDLDQQLQSTLP